MAVGLSNFGSIRSRYSSLKYSINFDLTFDTIAMLEMILLNHVGLLEDSMLGDVSEKLHFLSPLSENPIHLFAGLKSAFGFLSFALFCLSLSATGMSQWAATP